MSMHDSPFLDRPIHLGAPPERVASQVHHRNLREVVSTKNFNIRRNESIIHLHHIFLPVDSALFLPLTELCHATSACESRVTHCSEEQHPSFAFSATEALSRRRGRRWLSNIPLQSTYRQAFSIPSTPFAACTTSKPSLSRDLDSPFRHTIESSMSNACCLR
jgi:hypothetical protein